MGKQQNSTELSYPKALTPECASNRLADSTRHTLDKLANRGIFLNTWQALEFQGQGCGNRALGKTQLAYVKIAETHKDTGFSVNCKEAVTEFDPDVCTQHMYIEFIKGLKSFILEYYSDMYMVEEVTTISISLRPLKSSNRRWWNKGI